MSFCPICKAQTAPQDRRRIELDTTDEDPVIGFVCTVCAEKLRRKLTGETKHKDNKSKHRARIEAELEQVLEIIRSNPGINSLEISDQLNISYDAARLRTKDLEHAGSIEGKWVQQRGRIWTPVYRN